MLVAYIFGRVGQLCMKATRGEDKKILGIPKLILIYQDFKKESLTTSSFFTILLYNLELNYLLGGKWGMLGLTSNAYKKILFGSPPPHILLLYICRIPKWEFWHQNGSRVVLELANQTPPQLPFANK